MLETRSSQPDPFTLICDHDDVAFLLEPTRRRILAELAEPDSAAGLARRLGLPRQRLGHHLRELERGGFIECVEERRRRNCVERLMRVTARSFVLQPPPLGAALAGGREAASQASAAYLVAVASRAQREVGELAARGRSQGKPFATLALDGEIRFRNAAERATFGEELAACLADLTARFHDPSAPQGRSFRCAVLVHPSPSATSQAGPGERDADPERPS